MQKILAAKEAMTAIELLRANDIFVESVIVVKSGSPIPLDTMLESGDEVTVFEVLSGG